MHIFAVRRELAPAVFYKIWNMHEKFSENFMKNYCKKEIGSV